ncbi:MAG: helix-turn-helix domain-containing protein [Candidatus Coatesbacteria bacterium]
MNPVLDRSTDMAWQRLEGLLAIDSETDYRRARGILEALVDEVGSDEGHPRAALLDTLATLVHAWEERHHPVPAAAPRHVLAFLMEEHGLKQAELEEVGSQGIVSEILAGKRELNVRQIRALARRFGVSPAVFVG